MNELNTKQKVALAAALGTGVVVGATGIIIYQRLNKALYNLGSSRDSDSDPFFFGWIRIRPYVLQK